MEVTRRALVYTVTMSPDEHRTYTREGTRGETTIEPEAVLKRLAEGHATLYAGQHGELRAARIADRFGRLTPAQQAQVLALIPEAAENE
jgi:hypothetical protein